MVDLFIHFWIFMAGMASGYLIPLIYYAVRDRYG